MSINFSGKDFSIMGVINITPDSFYEGSRASSANLALDKAVRFINEGADILDIGACSTRPGAQPISVDEELSRLIPVIEIIAKNVDVAISVDTYHAAVMEAAVKAGATLINDVYALRQPNALATAAKLDVPVCLMHMQNTPATMQNAPQYANVIDEVRAFFDERLLACAEMGIATDKIILDPGIGFGKTVAHNLTLLKNLNVFLSYNLPLLIGVSRKSMIAQLIETPVSQRLPGSLAMAAWAYEQGAHVFRVHDVAETKQALTVTKALMEA